MASLWSSVAVPRPGAGRVGRCGRRGRAPGACPPRRGLAAGRCWCGRAGRPGCRHRSAAVPGPASRKRRPFWVAGGMVSSSRLPPRASMVTWAPSRASPSVRGSSMPRSSPSRREDRVPRDVDGDVDVAAALGLAGEADALAVGDARRDADLEALAADLDVALGAAQDLFQADGRVRRGVGRCAVGVAGACRAGCRCRSRTRRSRRHCPRRGRRRAARSRGRSRGHSRGRWRRPRPCRPPKKVRKKSLKPERSAASPWNSKRIAARAATAGRSGEAGEGSAPGSAGPLVGRPVGAELVVGLALLRIGEDLVGLADLLEALLGGRVSLVDVRMVLAGKATVGLLDVGLRGALVDAEGGVVVAILHPVSVAR